MRVPIAYNGHSHGTHSKETMNREELARQIYETSYITGQFLLRSGQTSDRYFDKYLFESYPQLLRQIAQQMVALIPPGTKRLAGLEMGGIPLATALSLETGLPCLFVRKKAKEYGTCKFAEGVWEPDDAITVIEDVITSGGQAVISANELKDLGLEIKAVLGVIDREAGGGENIRNAGFSFSALFTMSELTGA